MLILLDVVVTVTALLATLQIAPWATTAGGIAVVVIAAFTLIYANMSRKIRPR